jgi:hypothetical protein
MRPEEHPDAGPDHEGVALIHARVFHAGEELEAVADWSY